MPHYPLTVVKALVSEGKVFATRTALKDAAAIGLDFDEMLRVLLNLEIADFFKSMTTHADHSIWQDVYHYPSEVGEIYLKLQIVESVLIVSFKEK